MLSQVARVQQPAKMLPIGNILLRARLRPQGPLAVGKFRDHLIPLYGSKNTNLSEMFRSTTLNRLQPAFSRPA
jgi:hypothetical protein